MHKLSQDFYERDDVVQIARDLIGKVLCTNINGKYSSGIIVETEAYNGRTDRACHAFNRRTPRTEVMYQQAGVAYVYLCYGIHHLFNIVTNKEGLADAVLLRAVEPLEGIEYMEARRNMSSGKVALTSGPGSMAKALGINGSHNEEVLSGDLIWVEDRENSSFEIEIRRRVGVDYAGEDADLPWRFNMVDNKWVSKPKYY